jgi:surface antigen
MNKLIAVAATALALTVSACDFNSVVDAVDRFDLIIQLEEIESFGVGQVVDARTGELIDADFDVQILGRDRAHVVDFYGDRLESIRARRGMFTFGVQPGISPREDSPVQFALVIDAPGYERSTSAVSLNRDGEHAVRIELIAENAQFEGSSSATASTPQSEPLTVRAQVGDMAAGIDVGAGSWRGADGSTPTGDVTARVRYHTGSSSALASLPTFVTADGEMFGALGAFTVDARDAGGRSVVAGAGSTGWVSLSASTINAATGAPYSSGDILHVLAFDEEAGAWVAFGNALVENGGATFQLNGSSAAKVGSAGRKIQTFAVAGSSSVVSVNWSAERNGHDGEVRVVWRASGDVAQTRSWTFPAGSEVGGSSRLSVPGKFVFDLPDGQSYVHAVSQAGDEVITLPAQAANVSDVRFDLELSCTLKLRPPFNAALYYRLVSDRKGSRSAGIPEWSLDSYGRVKGGTLTIPAMQIGERYLFTLVTPEETAWEEIEITSGNMTYSAAVPSGFCVR